DRRPAQPGGCARNRRRPAGRGPWRVASRGGPMILRPLLMAMLSASLAACATSAPLRDNAPGTAPSAGTDEAELWYAMERAEAELRRSPLRMREEALNAYIAKVACK